MSDDAATQMSYDVAIIGSGSGNLLVSREFADKRIALIERGPIGGTCLNTGCIPTKMLTYPADLTVACRGLPSFGIDATVGAAHWEQIRDRVLNKINHDSEAALQTRQEQPNVDVYNDEARFVSATTLRVGEQLITADHVVIAAGSRPHMPDLPGMEEAASRLHTTDSILRLAKLPKTLAILGGGPVAVEYAHIFTSLGVDVTIINRRSALLGACDADVSAAVTTQLGERVKVRLRQQVVAFESTPRSLIIVTHDRDGVEYEYEAELALVAMGRVPNSDTLGCAEVGIACDEAGRVVVDEYQRTSVPNVWALGDVCSLRQLKHVANRQAKVVQHNLLNPDHLMATDMSVIPAAVFTHPQVAWVGMTEAEAVESGRRVVTSRRDYADVAYGWAMGVEPGQNFVKIIADADSKQLLGAHIVGEQAATLIQPCVQAMALGTDIPTLARAPMWIHPALTEVIENALLDVRW